MESRISQHCGRDEKMSPRKLILVVAICLAAPIVARAQGTTTNPVVASAREIFERQSKFIAAAADEMPSDKYSYHPTPDQWSFGNIVSHVARSISLVCSMISGTPAPQNGKVTETDSKEKMACRAACVLRFLLEGADKSPGFPTGRHREVFRRPRSAASTCADRIDRRPGRSLLAARRLPAPERHAAALGPASQVTAPPVHM